MAEMDWQETLVFLTPQLASLACVSFVVMISNVFKGKNKMIFQTMVMCLATAYSAYYFATTHTDDVLRFWGMYKQMTYEFKFLLGVFTCGAAYFGGALYLSNVVITQSVSSDEVLSTPATAPVQSMAELPKSLPEDDKEFFSKMLKRCTEFLLQFLGVNKEYYFS